MKTLIAVVLVVFVTCFFFTSTLCAQQTEHKTHPKVEHYATELQKSLTMIDNTVVKQISAHQSKLETDADIYKLLNAILTEHPNVEACFVDNKGILKLVAPEMYKSAEGADINDQAHVILMLKEPKPILSSGFMAVEGYLGVVLARPLYNSNKQFLGSINLVLRPDILLQDVIKDNPVGDEVWTMQPDGMIICDDADEVGKNLFTDPMYKDFESLRQLGKKISANPSGSGEYSFYASGTQKPVKKSATWATMKFHDRIWRVVLTHRI
ncbi:MAG: hypothetical protein CVU48_11150 [Candidatus Cloacimonetes bacterium HGW-Cloacimonetes-1]|jgi:uncharacterized lipoprotein YehR (DUF1307 family)|nr:MAG: hypothetical protein CVU48_11150 [Candidatus Cloacimonetes bacterium HGW-Cloacimonetes-1]